MFYIRKIDRAHAILFATIAFAMPTTPLFSQTTSEVMEQIGYNRLVTELSANGTPIPNGSGIRVGIVEFPNAGNILPNSSLPRFNGKTFHDIGGNGGATNNHATTVATNLVGIGTSVASGIQNIDVYSTDHFLNDILSSGSNPSSIPARVLNHSYVAYESSLGSSLSTIARMDYAINRDQIINIVSLNNGASTTTPHVFANSFNSIVVGLTNGTHSSGDTVGYDVGPNVGRTKPDLVAPSSSVSYATPTVASTAAMLHSVAVDNGMTNATRPETMKAILMAGADKNAGFGNSTSPTAWSNTTSKPLDAHYGAGELDVYNSYNILTAGEFDGALAMNASPTSRTGWDFGTIDFSDELFWTFDISPELSSNEVSILLTWNANFEDALGDFNPVLSLADMQLNLWDLGNPNAPLTYSNSFVDNVEHIYLRDLAVGRYAFSITSDALSDYAIAWNVTAVPEPTSTMLVCAAGTLAIGWARRRKHGLNLPSQAT